MTIKAKKHQQAITEMPESTGEPVQRRKRIYTEELQHKPDSYRFFIPVHHPQSWEVVGNEVLPKITRAFVVGGANGVTGSGPEADDTHLVKLLERNQGFIQLEDDSNPLVLRHKVARGHIYLFPWESPYMAGRNPKIKVDPKVREAVQREVFEAVYSGEHHIPGLEELKGKIERLLLKLGTGSVSKQARAKLEANLKVADRVLKEATQGAEPKPKAKAKPKKAEPEAVAAEA